jgi:hypothetical protein
MASLAAKAQEEPQRPVVDLARIRQTYAELKRMEVKLDPNPIEYGPQRFNNRIAQVRSMLNRVDQIFLQVSEDLHIFKRIINAKRTLYEFEKRELMVNDPRCRVGRSQGEREALADVQLRETLEELADLEGAAHDLETLMISIKSKRTDLKDAQSRMRDQMKMIEHDIGMGARWGNNPAPALTSNVSEINSMLADVDSGLGISDDEDEVEEDEEEEGDDELEDEDEEETEDEEVVVEDARHDPSPHVEDEPVLVFGEEGIADSEASSDSSDEDEFEKILPAEGEEKELPAESASSDDVETFLDAIGDLEGDEDEDEEEDEEEISGIDDLIASLADED